MCVLLVCVSQIAENVRNPVKGNIINHPNGENNWPFVKDNIVRGLPHAHSRGMPHLPPCSMPPAQCAAARRWHSRRRVSSRAQEWARVLQDYSGKDVNPMNILAALRGDKEAIKLTDSRSTGKIIGSGPDDKIFFYFAVNRTPRKPQCRPMIRDRAATTRGVIRGLRISFSFSSSSFSSSFRCCFCCCWHSWPFLIFLAVLTGPRRAGADRHAGGLAGRLPLRTQPHRHRQGNRGRENTILLKTSPRSLWNTPLKVEEQHD